MHKLINGLLRTKVYVIPIIFSGILFLSSCQKSDSVSLSQDQLLAIAITDTINLETSTLLLDSLPTAAQGLLLAGTITDRELGRIRAISYFQVAPPGLSDLTLPDDAVFDSLSLKLTYSGYHYGDTTVQQTLSAHQLSSRLAITSSPGYLEPEESNVFSSSATFYNRTMPEFKPDPIASRIFKPRPASGDSLLLKLPDPLGRDLFNMVRNNDSRINNTEEFLNYFKGIALQSDGDAVIGYKDSAQVKMHYSYMGTDGLKKKNQIIFDLYDTNYQFNSFSADRSNTALRDLSLQNRIIPASATDNKTYLQGGIGLVTKISIPYIAYLSGDDHVSINKAELHIQSTTGSNKYLALPKELTLFVANANNVPQSILTDASGNPIVPGLNQQLSGIEKASYSASLTNYIGNYLKSYSNTSLLLSLPAKELESSLGRLEIGSANHPSANIKLIITYTKF
jgi:hypothetical protein